MTPSDPLDLAASLTSDERAFLTRLQAFLDTRVRPRMAEAWERAEMPPDVLPGLAEVLGDTPLDRPLLYGMVKRELGRADPSLCSMFSVHWGLCRGAIARFGSDAQRARWLGPLGRFEALGAFGLTEPDAGSAITSEMATTARRDGDTWVLDGQKRWIGNAPDADVIVVFARTDAGVGAFLVERGAPGLSVEVMTGKIAKRAIRNGHVRLVGVRLPDAARLPGVQRFGDVTTHLSHGRVSVAWEALGIATGAFELARAHTLERRQFGRPIAGFQLVQDRLASMACTLASMGAVLLQLARLEESGEALTPERASLAKRTCAEGMRAVVADARALMGGEGLLLNREVARLFADAEAVYTYEGTHEINTLILGRALTGIAAFK